MYDLSAVISKRSPFNKSFAFCPLTIPCWLLVLYAHLIYLQQSDGEGFQTISKMFQVCKNIITLYGPHFFFCLCRLQMLLFLLDEAVLLDISGDSMIWKWNKWVVYQEWLRQNGKVGRLKCKNFNKYCIAMIVLVNNSLWYIFSSFIWQFFIFFILIFEKCDRIWMTY